MPTYFYQALDQGGNDVSGEISANSVSNAVVDLESRGLSVQSISAAHDPNVFAPTPSRRARHSAIRPNESSLDDKFDAVLERRDTLIPALRALVQELPMGRAKREIGQLIQEISVARNGTDLRQSKQAICWLPLLVSGFSAEPTTRRLSDLIAYATRDLQIRSERRRVLAYPLIVLIGAMIVLGLLSLWVVPIFDNMFSDFGLQLPSPTMALLELSRQLRFHPLRSLLFVGVGAALVYAAVRVWTHFALTTRLFGFAVRGNSSSVSAMSTLTGQLAELLQVGLSLPDAIWISGHGCDHYYFRKAAEQLARDVYSADGPIGVCAAANLFPANVIHALDPGEGRPSIPLLRELSEMYAQRVHRRTDWSGGALAQVSMVCLGLMIGFMLIALLMPLMTLITGLS